MARVYVDRVVGMVKCEIWLLASVVETMQTSTAAMQSALHALTKDLEHKLQELRRPDGTET
jgi:hypothetical protein